MMREDTPHRTDAFSRLVDRLHRAVPSPRARKTIRQLLALTFFILLCRAIVNAQDTAQPTPRQEAQRLEAAFQQVARQVAPSVVGIRTQRRQVTHISGAEGPREFEQLVHVNGAGAILDADGLILTNEHVIRSAARIDVFFSDGERRTAQLVAADTRSDLAVIRVDRAGLQAAVFCDWSTVARGQWTVALGNPFGLGGDGQLCVAAGVISNLDRRLPGLGESDDRLYADMIQMTTPINPGNSGGPLFNLSGELIGIVTAMHARAATDDGAAFAIPLSPARRAIIEQLKRGRDVQHAYIGLSVRPADPLEGVIVERVDVSGPAAKAGLREADRILRVGGRPASDPARVVDVVAATPVGRTLAIEFERDGKRREVSVVVEPREPERAAALRAGAILWRGVRVAELPPSFQRIDGVLIVDVAENSAAARAGLAAGDVIERVEQAAVQDVVAFRKLVSPRDGAVALRVRNRGEVIVPP